MKIPPAYLPVIIIVSIYDSEGCELISDPITVPQPQPLTITLDETNDPSCAGDTDGSILVSVSGGTPPYNYQWTGNVMTEDLINVGAGDYSLVVEDSRGCIATFGPETLTDPDGVQISNINVTHVACAGFNSGAINVDVSGGSPNYEYQWFDANK